MAVAVAGGTNVINISNWSPQFPSLSPQKQQTPQQQTTTRSTTLRHSPSSTPHHHEAAADQQRLARHHTATPPHEAGVWCRQPPATHQGTVPEPSSSSQRSSSSSQQPAGVPRRCDRRRARRALEGAGRECGRVQKGASLHGGCSGAVEGGWCLQLRLKLRKFAPDGETPLVGRCPLQPPHTAHDANHPAPCCPTHTTPAHALPCRSLSTPLTCWTRSTASRALGGCRSGGVRRQRLGRPTAAARTSSRGSCARPASRWVGVVGVGAVAASAEWHTALP
jgi:hypothetical protein